MVVGLVLRRLCFPGVLFPAEGLAHANGVVRSLLAEALRQGTRRPLATAVAGTVGMYGPAPGVVNKSITNQEIRRPDSCGLTLYRSIDARIIGGGK